MQRLLNGSEREEIINYCDRLYGVCADDWDGITLMKSSESIWAIPDVVHEFLQINCLDAAETSGMRIFSGKKFPYKITDAFIGRFFKVIKKGTLCLSGSELKKILFEKEIVLESEKDLQNGYVILKYDGIFIGVGLKRGLVITSQVPKKLTNQLSPKLEFSD